MPEPSQIPTHLAIIPDGNRRWAKEQGMFEIDGHRRGCEVAHEIARYCIKLGIKVLTLWGFSTENFRRSNTEVSVLMRLFDEFIRRYLDELISLNAQLRHIGNSRKVPESLRQTLGDAIEKSAHNDKLILNLAISYGGLDELLRAIKQIEDPKSITGADLMALLDTMDLPPVDLVIRTGGQQRLSGFMPLQVQYAELYFTPVYWPDFSADQLDRAIEWYARQKRNFGK